MNDLTPDSAAVRPIVIDIGVTGPVNGFGDPDKSGAYINVAVSSTTDDHRFRISLGAAEILCAELAGLLDFDPTERLLASRIAAAEKAEAERTETLEAICDALGIGIFARDRQTILTNIRNLLRRGACLSVVEDAFQDSCGEDDDQITTSKLSWGASPKEFEGQFNAAMVATKKAERVLALREALEVCQKYAEWTGLPRSAFAYERHIQRLITAAEAQPVGEERK